MCCYLVGINVLIKFAVLKEQAFSWSNSYVLLKWENSRYCGLVTNQNYSLSIIYYSKYTNNSWIMNKIKSLISHMAGKIINVISVMLSSFTCNAMLKKKNWVWVTGMDESCIWTTHQSLLLAWAPYSAKKRRINYFSTTKNKCNCKAVW